jgi:N-acetylglucosamine transport system substrate-binding protein
MSFSRRALLALPLAAASGCRFAPASHSGITELEVAVFEGGFGLDWHRTVARAYERLHPNVRINLWGDPRVDEKIKPRILRKNPPDLASCGLPAWKLITAGKVYPLDAALNSPAYGQPGKTWRDTLTRGVTADFTFEGKTYAMPTNLNAEVCWYDKRMFRKYGWQEPATWDEYLQLCEKIQSVGIAPLAFQGKYPVYSWWVLMNLFMRLVPVETYYAAQDLVPGAFVSAEFVEAARMLQEMSTRYFQTGAMAMTHTESQLEWVNGRAALVWCGLWLKNEMKKALPDGFEMGCFPVPQVTGGKGDQKAVYGGGGENFFVFKDAKNPELGLDFLKFLVSLENARTYAQKLDALSTVKDCTDGVVISPALESAVKVVKGASRIFNDRLEGLYLEFGKTELLDALANLLPGKITPEQFGQRLEASLEKVRRNPEIYKPPARGVPA